MRAVEVNLSRLHAFIGPNDSGKSTILRAIRTAAQFAVGEFSKGQESGMQGVQGHQGYQLALAPGEPARNGERDVQPFTPVLGEASGLISLTLESSLLEYQVGSDDGILSEFATQGGRALLSERQPRALLGKSSLWTSTFAHEDPRRRLAKLKDQLVPATLVRFDPDALRAAAPALLDTEGIRFADERGTGLAAVYDAIQNRDRDAITTIEQRVRELFPTVKRIELSVPARNMKAVKVSLKDGTAVSARDMSEGLLYFLGFAALQYCGASLLLVEEPENGLHPSRIRDVMKILRKIGETAQVVIATHSPLVINEMQPYEVTVVTRDGQGTHCVPILQTKGFDDRIKVYALGELWLSYANGMDESPLIHGGARE